MNYVDVNIKVDTRLPDINHDERVLSTEEASDLCDRQVKRLNEQLILLGD